LEPFEDETDDEIEYAVEENWEDMEDEYDEGSYE
jgi:hypothetical protein